MTTAPTTPAEMAAILSKLDPQLLEAAWRVLGALMNGGKDAALKELEIAADVFAFDAVEKQI
jgi:hypothetical protein